VTSIPSYTADAAYIFTGYAHADAGIIFQCMAYLQRQSINLFYDDGIRVGQIWCDELATGIDGEIGVLGKSSITRS
jgi:hypothetical protein